MKYFILIGMLSFQLTFSQTSLQAKALLDKVSNQIESYDNITFDFAYVLENKQEDIRQEAKGDVVVDGDRYKLNFLNITQISDGQKTYTIVPENEEVTINSVDEGDEFGINPSKLLHFYETGYDYQWDINQNVQGKKIQFVKLVPSDVNEDISYLLLGVNVKTYHIFRLIEIGKNGTKTTLTINNQKENVSLTQDYFVFNPSDYQNYYINEEF